jgi:hypothetical protein
MKPLMTPSPLPHRRAFQILQRPLTLRAPPGPSAAALRVLARESLAVVALTPALELVLSPVVGPASSAAMGAAGGGDGAAEQLTVEAMVRLRADVARNPALLQAAATAAAAAAAAPRPNRAASGEAPLAMDVDGPVAPANGRTQDETMPQEQGSPADSIDAAPVADGVADGTN